MSDIQCPEYPKIHGPFKRETEGPRRNQMLIGQWALPEFDDLKHVAWEWTEKVDGMNIRVHWDGHRVQFGGRTANAQLPSNLVGWLNENLPEELFEQTFGAEPVSLYGEGFGAGIQKGGAYSPLQSFILFDVLIRDWWLRRDGMEGVASCLGLDVVPLVLVGDVFEAITAVRTGLVSHWNENLIAEGLVGRIPSGLLSRKRERVIMKIKTPDFAPLGEDAVIDLSVAAYAA